MQAHPYVANAAQLERWLMQGAYNKVRACLLVPRGVWSCVAPHTHTALTSEPCLRARAVQLLEASRSHLSDLHAALMSQLATTVR